MTLVFPLIIVIVLFIIIVSGGTLLRKFLPNNHALQKYLTDDAIETYLAWIMRNGKNIAGGLLILTFTIITVIYS